MEYRCEGYIPVLSTPRLKLRRLERADAEPLFEYWSDPDVVQYMNVPPFADVGETAEMINWLNLLAETEDTIRWGIELKDSGRLIGSCGYNSWQLEGAYRAEIGYELGKSYWGQGYMHEALLAMFEFGFNVMGLNRIEALLYPVNKSSVRLLQKLGFQREGLLRDYQRAGDRFVDLDMYSMLRREWEQRSGANA
ncbi:acetyltransferase [Paenibacillus yonginensis]|uniref:Acetyltransferase n=2 Tax=Paenibacillus yonginensis TaxID=1462996 RepID=A0A1B1N629_9BACL|nr:acetyltransferase [Paenibacillus yonginensis]